MRPASRLPSSLLVPALLASFAAHAQGTLRCPLIRPPGLAAEQVDVAVMQNLAEELQRPPDAIDRAKTLEAIVGAGDAQASFASVTLAIGEALGVDAETAFAQAAHDGKPAWESLTIAQLQAAARNAYLAGHDGPPPAAVVGAAYRLHDVAVKSPAPAAGWVVLHCGDEQVTFQRGTRADMPLSIATARISGVPPYTDDTAFEKYLRATVASSLPGLAIQRIDVQLVAGSRMPCADVRVAGTLQDEDYGLRQRVCYVARDSRYAYVAMSSRLGDGGLAPLAALATADAFVVGASPK